MVNLVRNSLAIDSPQGTLVIIFKLKLSNGSAVTFDPPLVYSKKKVEVWDPSEGIYRDTGKYYFEGGNTQIEIHPTWTLEQARSAILLDLSRRWENTVWDYFGPGSQEEIDFSSEEYTNYLKESTRNLSERKDREYLLSVGTEVILPFDPIEVQGVQLPIDVDPVLERLWVDPSPLCPGALPVSVPLGNRSNESRHCARQELLRLVQNLRPKAPPPKPLDPEVVAGLDESVQATAEANRVPAFGVSDQGTFLLTTLGLTSLVTALLSPGKGGPKKRAPSIAQVDTLESDPLEEVSSELDLSTQMRNKT